MRRSSGRAADVQRLVGRPAAGMLAGVVGCLLLAPMIGAADEVAEPEKLVRYREALMKRPESEALFRRFSEAWIEQGAGENLVAYLEDLAEGEAPTAAMQAVLGRAHEATGADEAALTAYGEALELDAEAAWMRLQRGRLLIRLRRFDEAGRELLEIDPEDRLRTEAVVLAGRAMLQGGKNAEALALWEETLQNQPGNRALLEDVSELCRREGRTAQALDFTRRLLALEEDPLGRERVRLEVAELCLLSGRKDEAEEAFSTVLAASGAGSWLEREALERAAAGLRARSGLEAWMELLDEWSEAHPGRRELLRRRSRALGDAGRPEEALEVVSEWSRRFPGDEEALRVRIDLLEQSGQKDAAWEEMGELAARRPDDAELGRERMEMAFRQERREALRKLLGAQMEQAADAVARVRLGQAWLGYGFAEEAEALWQELAAGEGPAGAAAERALADLYRKQDKPDAEQAVWLRLGQRGGWESVSAAVEGLLRMRLPAEAAGLLEGGDFGGTPEAELRMRVALAAGDEETARRWAWLWLERAERPDEVAAAVAAVDRVVTEAAERRAFLGRDLKSPAERCLAATWRAEREPEVLGELLTDEDAEVARWLEEFHLDLLTRLGRWEEAALRLAGRVPERLGRGPHYRRLGELWQGARRPDEAAEAFRAWREASPENPAAWKAEAQALLQMDAAAGTRLLQRAVARLGAVEGLDELLISSLLRQSREREALELAWLAYRRAPEAEKRRWIGQLLSIVGRGNLHDILRERFEREAKEEAASPTPLLALAELAAARRSSGRDRSAADYLREALRRAPDDRELWQRLAKQHEAEQRHEEALRAWEAIARRWPGPGMPRELATARVRNGEIERGLREWQALASGEGAPLEECLAVAIGVADGGYLREAISFLSEVEPADAPRRLYLLGLMLEADGRETEAVEAYARCMAAAGAGESADDRWAVRVDGLLSGSPLRRSTLDPVRIADFVQAHAFSGRAPGVASAARRRLVWLASSVGGEAWQRAVAADPELALGSLEEWRALRRAGRQGLIEHARERLDSRLVARVLAQSRVDPQLDAEAWEQWIETLAPEPRESFELRCRSEAGQESLFGWLSGLGDELLDLPREQVLHMLGTIKVPEDGVDRFGALVDRLVPEAQRGERGYLGLRADLAALEGDDEEMLRWLDRVAVRVPEDDEAPSFVRLARIEGNFQTGALSQALRTTIHRAQLWQAAPRAHARLSEQADLAERLESPVLRAQFHALRRGDLEEWIEAHGDELEDEAIARDIEALRWLAASQSGKLEPQNIERMEEELRQRPGEPLAAFGVLLRLQGLAMGNPPDLQAIEDLLARTEESGVELPKQAATAAVSTIFARTLSFSGHRPTPMLPKRLAALLQAPALSAIRGFRVTPQPTTPTFSSLPPVSPAPPRWDSALATAALAAGDEQEAIRQAAEYLKSPAVRSGDSVLALLEKRDIARERVLAEIPRPTADEGLSRCALWIRRADECGAPREAAALVGEVAATRPWDAHWRLERWLRAERDEHGDLEALVREPEMLTRQLPARLDDRDADHFQRIVRRLLVGIDESVEEPWLGGLLPHLMIQRQRQPEDAEALEQLAKEVAMRLAHEAGGIQRCQQWLAPQKDWDAEMLAIARRCWLTEVAHRAEPSPEIYHPGLAVNGLAAGLFARAAELGDDTVFPESFLEELSAIAEEDAAWLRQLLAAGSCRGLPGPELGQRLIDWLAEPKDAEVHSTTPAPARLQLTLLRARHLGEKAALIAAMHPQTLRLAQGSALSGLQVAALRECEGGDELEAMLDRMLAGFAPEDAGVRQQMLQQVVNALTSEPTIWAATLRALQQRGEALQNLQAHAVRPKDFETAREMGLFGDLGTFARLGNWLTPPGAEEAPFFASIGHDVLERWRSTLGKDQREELLERLGGIDTFGSQLAASLLGQRPMEQILVAHDPDFRQLDAPVAEGLILSLFHDRPSSALEVGPVLRQILQARDQRWREESGEALEMVRQTLEGDDLEAKTLAMITLEDHKQKQRNQVAWWAAFETYVTLLDDPRSMPVPRDGVFQVAMHRMTPPQARRWFELRKSSAALGFKTQISNWSGHFWRSCFRDLRSSEAAVALVQAVLEHAPEAERPLLIEAWLDFATHATWPGEPGPADEPTGLLAVLRGWQAPGEGEDVHELHAVALLRALERYSPVEEMSPKAMERAALASGRISLPGAELLERLTRRRLAIPGPSDTDSPLGSMLSRVVHARDAEPASVDAALPLIRHLVEHGEISKSVRSSFTRAAVERGLTELAAALVTPGPQAESSNCEVLALLLRLGDVARAEAVLEKLPPAEWELSLFAAKGRYEDFAETRKKLSLDDPEQAVLAMLIDLTPDRERRPGPGNTGDRWAHWWLRMNRQPPEDASMAEVVTRLLFPGVHTLDGRMPLLERAVPEPAAQFRRALADRETRRLSIGNRMLLEIPMAAASSQAHDGRFAPLLEIANSIKGIDRPKDRRSFRWLSPFVIHPLMHAADDEGRVFPGEARELASTWIEILKSDPESSSQSTTKIVALLQRLADLAPGEEAKSEPLLPPYQASRNGRTFSFANDEMWRRSCVLWLEVQLRQAGEDLEATAFWKSAFEPERRSRWRPMFLLREPQLRETMPPEWLEGLLLEEIHQLEAEDVGWVREWIKTHRNEDGTPSPLQRALEGEGLLEAPEDPSQR